MKKNEKFRPGQSDYGEVSGSLTKLKFSLKVLMVLLLLIVLVKFMVYTIHVREIASSPRIEHFLKQKPMVMRKEAKPPKYDYYARKIREDEEKRVRMEIDLLKRLNLPESLMNNARTIIPE